jgi:hypothetical protein
MKNLAFGTLNALCTDMNKAYLIAMVLMLLWPICLKADEKNPEANVNEQYIVESIVYSGLEASKISQPLRDEAQKMVGAKYNEKTANGILKKIQKELGGHKEFYKISLKVEKGSNPDKVESVSSTGRLNPWVFLWRSQCGCTM